MHIYIPEAASMHGKSMSIVKSVVLSELATWIDLLQPLRRPLQLQIIDVSSYRSQ